jgi:excisionase family DNA binding protein
MPQANAQKLMTEGEVANFLGVDQSTIRRWRYEGNGPHFIRLGKKAIRYSYDDLQEHLSANRHKCTYEY